MFALLTQKLGHRVGQPHPQLYNLFRSQGYGAGSPFRSVSSGNNLYYQGMPSYNPASGIGVTVDIGEWVIYWNSQLMVLTPAEFTAAGFATT